MKYLLIVFLLVLAFPIIRAKVRKLGIVSGEEATTSAQVMTSAQVLQVSAGQQGQGSAGLLAAKVRLL